MVWFAGIVTVDDLKKAYRELAMKWHPDKGGDTATMQRINAEYAIAMAQAVRTEKPGYSADEFADEMTVQESIRVATEFACGLPDVDVTIRGAWVWVKGETKAVKDRLKEQKFRWSKSKQEWYFAGVRSFNRGRAWSVDEIEERYGADRVKRQHSAGVVWKGGSE